MDVNQQEVRAVESVKLLSDFGKWLVTVEITAVAGIGYVLTVRDPYAHSLARSLGGGAVVCFALSIVFVTALLRSLPTIMQVIKPGQSIWQTADKTTMSLGFGTSSLTILGSIFFCAGIALISVTLLVKLFNT